MNYHSWTYRKRVSDISSKEVTGLGSDTMCCLTLFFMQVILQDIADTRRWIRSHISDHCGYMHHVALVSQFISRCHAILSHSPSFKSYYIAAPSDWTTSPSEVYNLLRSEVEFSFKAIADYPGHDSAWCHLRGLLHLCVQTWPQDLACLSDDLALPYLQRLDLKSQCLEIPTVTNSKIEQSPPSPIDFLKFSQWCSSVSESEGCWEQVELSMVFQFHLLNMVSTP
jgi:hypothetical protein